MYSSITGRRAVVTGAGSGIGAAIGRRLAAEGARVALLDVDQDAAAQVAAELPEALVVRGDVRSASEVRAAVAEVVAAWGGVDILVNNAGVLGPARPLVDYPEDEFVRVLDIDLVGAYRLTRVALPHMLAEQWGRIVNIASIAARSGGPNLSAYAAAKAGLIGMSKSLSGELATSGVLVNCVAPGGVGGTAIADRAPEDLVGAAAQRHPMKRLATPPEVAALVAWLCSEEVSFSTGAVFDISGGRAPF